MESKVKRHKLKGERDAGKRRRERWDDSLVDRRQQSEIKVKVKRRERRLEGNKDIRQNP